MSTDPPARPRLVPCPTCRRDAVYAPSNPWRPFCSEHCRRIDLGAWASERFKVESPLERGEDETAV